MKLVKVLGVSNMINGISACVVVDYHEKIFGYFFFGTVEVVFDNLGFQAYGNCPGRSSNRDLNSPYFFVALTTTKALLWLVGALFGTKAREQILRDRGLQARVTQLLVGRETIVSG